MYLSENFRLDALIYMCTIGIFEREQSSGIKCNLSALFFTDVRVFISYNARRTAENFYVIFEKNSSEKNNNILLRVVNIQKHTELIFEIK